MRELMTGAHYITVGYSPLHLLLVDISLDYKLQLMVECTARWSVINDSLLRCRTSAMFSDDGPSSYNTKLDYMLSSVHLIANGDWKEGAGASAPKAS